MHGRPDQDGKPCHRRCTGSPIDWLSGWVVSVDLVSKWICGMRQRTCNNLRITATVADNQLCDLWAETKADAVGSLR